MVKDIAEGFVAVNERTFARFAVPDLERIGFELDRALRDIRGDQPSLDDLPAIQLRNRRLQRLTGAVTMLRAYRQKNRL